MIRSALGVVLVWLCCLPAVINTVRRLRRKKSEDQHTTKGYQDEDGIATASSLKEFSDKWQRMGIALVSGLGLLVAVVLGILTTSQRRTRPMFIHAWAQISVWVSFEHESFD